MLFVVDEVEHERSSSQSIYNPIPGIPFHYRHRLGKNIVR